MCVADHFFTCHSLSQLENKTTGSTVQISDMCSLTNCGPANESLGKDVRCDGRKDVRCDGRP